MKIPIMITKNWQYKPLLINYNSEIVSSQTFIVCHFGKDNTNYNYVGLKNGK